MTTHPWITPGDGYELCELAALELPLPVIFQDNDGIAAIGRDGSRRRLGAGLWNDHWPSCPVTWLPDGRLLFSKNTLRALDVENGRHEVFELMGDVTAGAVRWMLTTGPDGEVLFRKLALGEELQGGLYRLEASSGRVQTIWKDSAEGALWACVPVWSRRECVASIHTTIDGHEGMALEGRGQA